ncbi:MAG: 50S ribosomal protein L28 [Chitinophagales bacterium]|jgi:large subunit ribosomal protein L28|nr:50S ribosomal protein L28 [Chitinophagales bacterium]
MSRICELTNKKPLKGHYVSHSNVKTNRKFYPNLKTKKMFVPELNQWIQVKLSMHALRCINKVGLYQYLKDLEKSNN